MAYCVIRTDLMSGTTDPADLVSLRFYASEKAAQVENGVIVELEGYDTGSREVMKAKAATASSDFNKIAIVAGVEVNYDERKRNLEEYINEAGKITRGYIPRDRNMYAITKEGFVGGTVPSVKGKVGIGDGGKLSTSATGFGECVAIEKTGRHTYYVIQINHTDGHAGV